MKVRDITQQLESFAPLHLAEEWDNVGLLVGDAEATVRKLILCIDLTGAVLDEVIAAGAQMVMAYHPIIFKPINRLTARSQPVVYKAARKGIAVYSMHTALDVVPGGTNDVLAESMGLTELQPLDPTTGRDQCKIVVFTPPADLGNVATAAFEAGAGKIGGYSDCAFFSQGMGTFVGGEDTNPTLGAPGRAEAVEEVRLEVIAPLSCSTEVVGAIQDAHSYETPAIDVYRLESLPGDCGLGRVGTLDKAVTERALIARIKKAIGVGNVSLARPRGRTDAAKVSVAACCAGSCGSLAESAARAGATFYLTGEMRHHQALAATSAGLTVVCVGHSNSERKILRLLAKLLKKSLPKLQTAIARKDVDPFEIV